MSNFLHKLMCVACALSLSAPIKVTFASSEFDEIELDATSNTTSSVIEEDEEEEPAVREYKHCYSCGDILWGSFIILIPPAILSVFLSVIALAFSMFGGSDGKDDATNDCWKTLCDPNCGDTVPEWMCR